MALRLAVLAGTAGVALAWAATAFGATSSDARAPWPRGVAVVGYESEGALARALERARGLIVRRVPALQVAEVAPAHTLAEFAQEIVREPGIRYVERLTRRARAAEPGVLPAPVRGGAFEWQWAATRADAVAARVLRTASAVTIAVIDTGADLAAPDLAAKAPSAFNLHTRGADVRDINGHGTFVASLAAGSVTNDDGIAGLGGDANLLVIKASSGSNTLTDVDEAAAIVYAIEHGARIINLSFGGPTTTSTERRAIDFAVARGALLVAAAGNDYLNGNPVHYPAALLQPVGSQGRGGRGLVVGASTLTGARASFSNSGTHVSLAAPGERVLGAVSSLSSPLGYPRVALPGARAGLYGFGSGTSYATPQVAGAAALVWGANGALTASQVAQVLKSTASGLGVWTPELGYGVIDVASAVARAGGAEPVRLDAVPERQRVRLSWSSAAATSYRLTVSVNQRPAKVVIASTERTSASFSGAGGHTYAFSVTALGSDGAPLGASEPVRVRLAR